MRITNNTVSDSIVGQIQQLGSQQAKLQTQVATGQRIFQPEDDPAAAGRVLNLQTEQRRTAQYKNNAARALQISQATFSGLDSIKTISDRANQIATLGTGALNSSQTKAYAAEINQLLEQTFQLGNSTLGNDYLFAGTKVDTQPFTETQRTNGKLMSVGYAGNTVQQEIPLSEKVAVTPGTSGAMNQSLQGFMTQLIELRDALDAGDTTRITNVQDDLNDTENTLVSAMAEQGGVQSRIESHKSLQDDRATDLEKLISGETDVDLPTTIVKLTQTQTAYQAALQSAASIMKLSLLDYIN